MLRDVQTQRPAAELHLPTLADEVIAVVGQPVSVILAVDPAGLAVLDVLHPTENVDLPLTVDELLRIVDRHVPPPAPTDPLDDLIDELASATTVAGIGDAVTKWATRERGGRPTRRDRLTASEEP